MPQLCAGDVHCNVWILSSFVAKTTCLYLSIFTAYFLSNECPLHCQHINIVCTYKTTDILTTDLFWWQLNLMKLVLTRAVYYFNTFWDSHSVRVPQESSKSVSIILFLTCLFALVGDSYCCVCSAPPQAKFSDLSPAFPPHFVNFSRHLTQWGTDPSERK